MIDLLENLSGFSVKSIPSFGAWTFRLRQLKSLLRVLPRDKRQPKWSNFRLSENPWASVFTDVAIFYETTSSQMGDSIGQKNKRGRNLLCPPLFPGFTFDIYRGYGERIPTPCLRANLYPSCFSHIHHTWASVFSPIFGSHPRKEQ